MLRLGTLHHFYQGRIPTDNTALNIKHPRFYWEPLRDMTFWEDILLSLLTPLRDHFTQPSRLGIPTDKQTLDVQNEVGLISLGMLRLPLHLRS